VQAFTLKQLGLLPANPSLSDRLVLATTHAKTGTYISGFLLVTNHSATVITLTVECQPDWAVGLASGKRIVQRPPFDTACSPHSLLIQPGLHRYPVSVQTTYFGCTLSDGAEVALPACVDGHPPDLPAGTYDVLLFGSGDLPLPQSPPVGIQVTSSRAT
jgi:hypothetical protein